jgi:glucosylceramidase
MKQTNNLLWLLGLIILTVPGCGGDKKSGGTDGNHPGNQLVKVWMTTSDGGQRLAPQSIVTFTPDNGSNSRLIRVNENITYQIMAGFGASFTDSSAWLAHQLSPAVYQNLMTQLFDYTEGIGLSLLRQPMGATDYARSVYSYDDIPGGSDVALSNFSVHHDQADIIPVIQRALQMNPALKVIASPWSPPAWMKTTGSMMGQTNGTQSSLKPDCYSAYANYFVKFIQAYREQGIPIYAVTVQNEPHYAPAHYPGMFMSAQEQSNFINYHLGPALAASQLGTKILGWDHNWDNTDFAATVLSSAGNYVAGSAWHCYGGQASAMTTIHNAFPQKEIWFTEGSGGSWVGNGSWHDSFMDQMMHVIRIPRNWAQSIIWWNIALDQNNGPSLLSNSTCRGMVTIAGGDFTKNVDYYTMGHISKFVLPGAVRIDSNTFMNDLEDVAFKNPDGSKVLIVSNRTAAAKTFKVAWGSNSFTYSIPGEAALTFTW